MSQFGVAIKTMRPFNGSGSAVAFFSFDVGVEQEDGTLRAVFTVNDCTLNKSTRGDGDYWVSYPSKPRMRQGEHQRDDDDKPIYDDIVRPLFEKQADGTSKPTKASLKFKDHLTALALAAYNAESQESTGRGAARAAAAPAAAAGAARGARGTPPGRPGRRNAAPAPAAAQRARAAAAPALTGGDDFEDFPGALENDDDDDLPF
jgi:hypothetical protein